MPGGDRTGPMGLGPATGRRAGFCAGFSTPGFMNPVFGGGGGFWGRGRGRRNRFFSGAYPAGPRWGGGSFDDTFQGATATKESQVELLKEQADYLNNELDNIKKRMGELGVK